MDLKERLFQIFNNQIVGGSVVLINRDQEYKYNYGYSSLIEDKLVDDETIFRIASISKVIIMMSALKLVERGLLDLDEDISNILGFIIRNPKHLDVPITTKMLMLHRSSIISGPEDEDTYVGYNGVNGQHFFVSLEDLLTNQKSKYYTDQTYTDYAPGEKYLYSNFGMGIVACIIEKVSNQLFTDFVEEHFLKPLKIDASFKAKRIIKQDKISDTFSGFTTNKTAQFFLDLTYPDFPLGHNFRGPAGGLFTSMPDLSKIMIALMNDGKYKDVELLKKETVDYMLSMNFLASRIVGEKQINLKGHTGGAYGVSSVMYFAKSHQAGVCFIANGGNYQLAPSGLNNIQEAVINELVSEIEKNKVH